MAKNAFRFAVGSREDLRSSIWRLWANGDELYLATRSVAGISKISFHRSGICRYARNTKGPRKASVRWHRRSEIFPGHTILFAILVPPLLTKTPLRDKFEENTSVIFIEPPAPEQVAIFQIDLSPLACTKEDLLYLPNDKPITVHGSIRLKSNLAWLISFYMEFTA